VLWEQRKAGPVNFWDVPTSVTTDAAGNVIVTGYSTGVSAGYDFLTVKFAAASGGILWEQRYNGTGTGAAETAFAVKVDAAGHVLVAGTGATGSSAHVIKYHGVSGAMLWHFQTSLPATNMVFYDLALDAEANAFVTGRVGPAPGLDGYDDMLTLKLASVNGAILWEQRFAGPAGFDDGGMEIRVDPQGDPIVAGYSQRNSNGSSHRVQLLKYSGATGTPLWSTVTENNILPNKLEPREICLDAAGNVLLTGWLYDSPVGGRQHFLTSKFGGSDGVLQWERLCHWLPAPLPPNYQIVYRGDDVGVDSDGNVLVIGISSVSGKGSDHYAMKYSADGDLLWQNLYDGIYHFGEGPGAVAVDKDGHVVLAGTTTNANDRDEFHLWKNDGTTGALLWEVRRERSDGVNDDVVAALATDANGDVLLAGTGDIGIVNSMYLAKFAGASGALLWERRITSPVGSYRSLAKMVLDAAGNPYVTGSTAIAGQPTGADVYIGKYDGATGATTWERSYDSAADPMMNDKGIALVADSAGGVGVVLETTDSSGSDPRIRVIRYNGAGDFSWQATPVHKDGRPADITGDPQGNFSITGWAEDGSYIGILAAKFSPAGAPLWEKVIKGPANWAEGNALRTDAGGNVIVAGYVQSSRPSADYDYQTLKFATADGAILWQKTYTGPHDLDMADGVVIDSAGNVIVTGHSEISSQKFDLYTVKYAGSDGSTLGSNRYTASIQEQLLPFRFRQRAIAIGAGDRVAVANYTRPTGNDYDLAVMVYGIATPKLVVEHLPAGTVVANGSMVDAGTLADTATVQFRVRNTGAATLTFSVPTATAWAGGAFQIVPPLVTSLAGNSSIIFGVTLGKIDGGGAGSGTVQFTSNDATASSFQFGLNYHTPSNDPSLVSLGPDAGTLAPLFAATTTGYDLTLPFDCPEIHLSPVASHSGATVTVNGMTITPGTGSAAVAIPAAGAEIVIAVTAEDGVATRSYRLQARRVTRNLVEWRFLHFNSHEDSGTAANLADFDGDGTVNLLEYAFGLDPQSVDAQGVPTAAGADGYLTIRFTEPAGVSGLTYGARSSTNLSGDSWIPVPDEGIAPEHVFRVPATAPCLFLRLEVNPTEP
jgi:hypothetical protein